MSGFHSLKPPIPRLPPEVSVAIQFFLTVALQFCLLQIASHNAGESCYSQFGGKGNCEAECPRFDQGRRYTSSSTLSNKSHFKLMLISAALIVIIIFFYIYCLPARHVPAFKHMDGSGSYSHGYWVNGMVLPSLWPRSFRDDAARGRVI